MLTKDAIVSNAVVLAAANSSASYCAAVLIALALVLYSPTKGVISATSVAASTLPKYSLIKAVNVSCSSLLKADKER